MSIKQLQALKILLGLFWLALGTSTQHAHALSAEDLAKIDVPCVKPPEPPVGYGRKSLDPSRLFLVDLGPHRFAVPWKYFKGRPSPDMKSCHRDHPNLPIQFWIPDGKAPDKNHSIRKPFQPPDEAHPDPKPNEWLIFVDSMQSYANSLKRRYNPELRYRSTLNRMNEKPEYKNGINAYLLEETRLRVYYYYSNEDYHLFFRCVNEKETDRRRMCSVFFDLRNWELSGLLSLPLDAVGLHAEIIGTLEGLLMQWEVAK
ncbi:hypothetical protein [Labrenzia sp. CE80]|uniref:hypothetical protein n=1 Tax=Labrenzia sp. CE80 TaxID=1788986 RepID=UPI00129BA449|nr:hypothetical protein [Labrenzia sp. CE80]